MARGRWILLSMSWVRDRERKKITTTGVARARLLSPRQPPRRREPGDSMAAGRRPSPGAVRQHLRLADAMTGEGTLRFSELPRHAQSPGRPSVIEHLPPSPYVRVLLQACNHHGAWGYYLACFEPCPGISNTWDAKADSRASKPLTGPPESPTDDRSFIDYYLVDWSFCLSSNLNHVRYFATAFYFDHQRC
jgi:hypothetical protein